MRSIPQALLWEILSHGRWSIPGCFLLANLMPVLVYGALSVFPFDPTNQEFVVLQFAFIPILVLQLAGGLVIALGPVSRLYFAPISASSIVAWHMFAGAAILAGETVLAAWLYNTVFHVNWPILGAGLFAAAAWSAIQLLICASTRSFVMVCIGGLPGVLLCLWLQSRFGAWFSPPKHFWNEVTAIDFATLAFTFGVCTVLSTWSVQWSRCGEHPLKLRLLSWLDAQLNSILASRKLNRFRSPAAAQFWFEWQLKGRALPICTLIVVLVFSIFGFGIWCIDRVSPTKLYEVVLILGGLLSLLAIGSGFMLGVDISSQTAGQRQTQLGDVMDSIQFDSFGSFMSSRPVTNADFAKALLKTAAASCLVSWCVWFAYYLSFVALLTVSHQAPGNWIPLRMGMLWFPLTLLGPWVVSANIAALAQTGRGVKILLWTCGGLTGVLILFLVMLKFVPVSAASQFYTVFIWTSAVLIVFVSILAFMRAKQQQHLRTSSLLTAALIGCCMAIAGFAFLPADTQRFEYPLVFGFAALAVLPVATLPLAIAWNRHR